MLFTNYTAAQELVMSMRAQLNEYSESDFVDDVITSVCRVLDVTKTGLKSSSRKTEVVEARYIVMSILVTHHKMTKRSVGFLFNRDHSTVVVGLEKYQSLVDAKDKPFLRKINLVLEEIGGICA